jgi:hypothetical protein
MEEGAVEGLQNLALLVSFILVDIYLCSLLFFCFGQTVKYLPNSDDG